MKNAAYLDSAWFSDGLTDDQINDYLWFMSDNSITNQFCDIGILNDDGTLPAIGCAQLGNWISKVRSFDKSMKVIPALNYANRKTNESFGSDEFNTNLKLAIQYLFSTYDIDGIHLDIEGFIHDDAVLLNLLQYLKSDVLAGKHLSIATPDFWKPAFIAQVASVVDQVNVMAYDAMGWGSVVVNAKSYETYYKQTVLKYSAAIGDLPCELVPCFPVYEKKKAEDGTVYHDPAVESMKVAIMATNQAISIHGARVVGAAIFWMPHFMGLHPNQYRGYAKDQQQWMDFWINA